MLTLQTHDFAALAMVLLLLLRLLLYSLQHLNQTLLLGVKFQL